MRFVYFFLSFLICMSFTYGMAITGEHLVVQRYFEPGLKTEYSYTISSGESYTVDYYMTTQYMKGHDLRPYFKFVPERQKDIGPGDSVQFKVIMELPDEISTPGESEVWVAARIDGSSKGILRAFPSVAARYIIFVLFPFKYVEWQLHTPAMNINETVDFTVEISNLGEPIINLAHADIIVTNKETGEVVRSLKTGNALDIEPSKIVKLKTQFTSLGLKPGNYLANATLYWDNNISYITKDVKIGSKTVKVVNFTRLFEYDNINEFDIIVESAWNTKINDIYAEVEIFDMNDNRVDKFKTPSTILNPWQQKQLDKSYFDAIGLKKGDYKVVIELIYEESRTTKKGMIKIDENVNSAVVEEIPGKFKFSNYITTTNMLILLIVIFLLINVYLVLGYVVKKKDMIDPAVIEHIKKLKEKYSDEYIKEMMIKKGWALDKIERILKKAKK